MGKSLSKYASRLEDEAIITMRNAVIDPHPGSYNAAFNPESAPVSWQSRSFNSSIPGMLTQFTYQEIASATRNFSTVIGRGGFATVYRGLSRGVEVAVKKLEMRHGVQMGNHEFEAEISSGSANHKYTVKLIGFSAEFGHRLLVYEYMSNASLDKWIFGAKEDNVLDWRVRYSIALGVAQALSYLHHSCRDQIVHFDIKPQNILLDANFQPKLADFGAARMRSRMYENQSLERSQVLFTAGYAAPEVLLNVGVTEKCDVFSYGLVLLELVSGRRTRDEKLEEREKRYFPAWAQYCLAGEALDPDDAKPDTNVLDELVDKNLRGKFDKKEAMRLFKIGLSCIQREPELRPSMTQVVHMLEGHVQATMPPENCGFRAVILDALNISFASNHNFFTSTSTESMEIQSLYSSTESALWRKPSFQQAWASSDSPAFDGFHLDTCEFEST